MPCLLKTMKILHPAERFFKNCLSEKTNKKLATDLSTALYFKSILTTIREYRLCGQPKGRPVLHEIILYPGLLWEGPHPLLQGNTDLFFLEKHMHFDMSPPPPTEHKVR